MTNPIDELRKILLSRAPKQPAALAAQQPATQPAASDDKGPQGLYAALQGRGAAEVPGSREASVDTRAVSDAAPQSSLLSGLRKALAGSSGSGGPPRSGIHPPSWPGTPGPMAPGDLPIGLPNESARVPPRWQRFETGQRMQDAYRNNWQPNPMIVRLLGGR